MTHYPADEFAEWHEWTVVRREGDTWSPVGTSGSPEHVLNEMADWRRDCPDAQLVFATRRVGPWTCADCGGRFGSHPDVHLRPGGAA